MTDFNMGTVTAAQGVRFVGEPNWQVGTGVQVVGDVNGDGIDDFVVGAYITNYAAGTGAAFVVFGKAGGFGTNEIKLSALNGTDGFRINGDSSANKMWLGRGVAAAGDINGDGFADIVLGAPAASFNAGKAVVVFGKASFGATLNVADLNGSNGFVINGAINTMAGSSVGTAGDFNGDGIDDLLVGVPNLTTNNTGGGGAYVIFGRDASAGETFGGSFNLSTMTGQDGALVYGAGGDRMGASVSAAGDFNGDGMQDFIVGAYLEGNNDEGGVYVVFGHDEMTSPPAAIYGQDLFTNEAFRIGSSVNQNRIGQHVSGMGDVNGDGVDDIAFTSTQTSSVYVVFGQARDPWDPRPWMDVSELDGTNGFRLQNPSGGLGTGLTGIGDFNDDGFDDFMTGNYTGNGLRGQAFIIYGRASFGSGSLNLATLTDYDTITGAMTWDHLGRWMGGGLGGDINGDGHADIVVGSHFYDTDGAGNNIAGGALILYGGPTPKNFTGGAGDESFTGGGAVDTLNGGGGKDVLNGAGGDDVIDGGDGNDTLDGGDGADDIVGGLGNDVLNGGAGDDVLTDASGSNKLNGGDGDDQLFGASGADRLNGENDDDILEGGAGNDYLDGGAGVNSLTGGLGNDIFIVRSAGDTVIEAAGQGTDTVRSTISYTLADNVEVLELLTGTNINGTGNGLGNTLRGNGGNNTLSGLDGADKLDGGAGDDVLIGGVGRDQLTGGAGADTFRVLAESLDITPLEIDTVLDYEVGIDRLDFSQIDANGDADDGDTSFIVSTTGLHRIAGELFVFYTATVGVGGTTTVRLDVDGDGLADYQMAILGDATADAGRWLL